MRDLLIQALDEAYIIYFNQIPKTKKEIKSISIIDVSPLDLINFIKDNNIPNNCYFDGKDNGYDGWDDILLSWEIDVPTTDIDRVSYLITRFNNGYFKYVYKILTNNGFKRISPWSYKLKEFNDTTIYHMYINKEFDRLEKYFSMYFEKL